MSKPTEWPTSGASPTKSRALRAASAGVGAPLTSLSVMPCIWLPTIGRPGFTNVDQRSVILPPLTRTAATSTRSAILGSVPVVSTSTTTNSPPAFARSAKVRTEPVSGLEVRETLGLADELPELLLEVDERRDGAVAEEDGLGHDVLGEDLDARLDHHDGVAGAGDDEVELRVRELRVRRVEHELAVDPADAHGADGTLERDLADREGGGRGDGAEDVRVVLVVRREDGDDELDVVLVALGEERPDGAVGEARRERRGLGRAALALDEAAGDLARGVHPLLEVDRQREEVEAGAGLGAVRGPEDHRVAVAEGDGAAGEAGELAGLQDQLTTAELDLERGGSGHGVNDLLGRTCEDALRPVGPGSPGTGAGCDRPRDMARGRDAASPSGEARASR